VRDKKIGGGGGSERGRVVSASELRAGSSREGRRGMKRNNTSSLSLEIMLLDCSHLCLTVLFLFLGLLSVSQLILFSSFSPSVLCKKHYIHKLLTVHE